MNDRLSELRLASGTVSYFDPDCPSSPEREAAFTRAVNADISAHLHFYTPIQQSITEIELNDKRVRQLAAHGRSLVNAQQRRDFTRQLDAIIENSATHGHAVRTALEQIQAANNEYIAQSQYNGGVNLTARVNLFQQHSQRFRSALERFNQALKGIREEIQVRTVREIKMASGGQMLSEGDIQSIIQSGQAEAFIEQAIIGQGLQESVAAIKERNNEIKHLEKQIIDIFQLFCDLQSVVAVQSESINSISVNLASSASLVRHGERQLGQASNYLSKIRKRKCIIITIIIVALLVILVPIIAVYSSK